jgi:hypothetical protein
VCRHAALRSLYVDEDGYDGRRVLAQGRNDAGICGLLKESSRALFSTRPRKVNSEQTGVRTGACGIALPTKRLEVLKGIHCTVLYRIAAGHLTSTSRHISYHIWHKKSSGKKSREISKSIVYSTLYWTYGVTLTFVCQCILYRLGLKNGTTSLRRLEILHAYCTIQDAKCLRVGGNT